MNNFEQHKVVNLKAADTKVFLHTEMGGDEGRVMWEIFPEHFTGNAPGMMVRLMQPWAKALETAVALKATAQSIHDGVDVVPGTKAAPVLFYLDRSGEWGSALRLVLTEEDCLALMHGLTQACEHATKKAPITVATTLPRR